ncbi:MAG TPA: glycosyltransferase [Casimicrobiaceae bacterium]|nr:glycosyltransferase [Casimicrobiaceae bacterium]
MKSVLMVAFHFPPVQGSSGVQRTLRFARHLPEFGWQPVVLTAHPRAYESTSDDQVGEIPSSVAVIRAQAWDAARHFTVRGRYLAMTARPDRWISWWLGGVPAGLAAIRRHRPSVLWSTYPIATAHCIGATLQARSGLPWIADFRDPMAQDGYPEDAATWRSFERIERRSVTRATTSTFTTPGALREYRARYPERASRMALLENGYDEETFASARPGPALNPGRLTLLHSGIVYPDERDPRSLFAALRAMKDADPAAFVRLRVRFRAPVHGDLLSGLARQHGIEEAIEVLPPVGYREALSEMLSADGLLVLQAANCNAQVPAKLYEYLRARRPILAFTDPAGDTAAVARAAGISAIAPLDAAEDIGRLLLRFVAAPAEGTLPRDAAVAEASRHHRARQLAAMLDDADAGARR